MHDYSRDLLPAKWGSGVKLHAAIVQRQCPRGTRRAWTSEQVRTLKTLARKNLLEELPVR
jgi:hypothetical protein